MARKEEPETRAAKRNARPLPGTRMGKRTLVRDDGRYLIYYRFAPQEQKPTQVGEARYV